MTGGPRKGWRQRLCDVCRHRCWYAWRNNGAEPVAVKNGRTYGAWVALEPGKHACSCCVEATPALAGKPEGKLERLEPATDADMVPCPRCDSLGEVETSGGRWVPGDGQTIVAAARGTRRCPRCRGEKAVPS